VRIPYHGPLGTTRLVRTQEAQSMQNVELKPVADQLGITTSKLRYFLEREAVVPYRKLDLGGDWHVRYFTPEDSAAITQWWKRRNEA
jgi:hypothetical protein